MSPGNAFLVLNVLIFGGFGLAGLFAPEEMLSGAGVIFEAGSSTVDLRATYGGAILGFTVFLASCVGGTRGRVGLAAVFCLTLGALVGRLYGLSVDQAPGLMWILAAVEAVWSLLAAWLWLRYPRQIRNQ